MLAEGAIFKSIVCTVSKNEITTLILPLPVTTMIISWHMLELVAAWFSSLVTSVHRQFIMWLDVLLVRNMGQKLLDQKLIKGN